MSRQKLGQHFLIKGSILDRIAAAVCDSAEPLVIEIGPGKGALTRRLLARAERVIAIEVDSHLVRYLEEKFRGEPRLTVVEADALEVDLTHWGPAPVAGNLPYYAATAIVARVLKLGDAAPRSVFLVQKEVAERLTATPGHRDYGYLTVQVKLFADCERLFEVKPAAFFPPPKVDSAVVRLTPRETARELGITSTEEFLRFVSLCFRHKRKTIRNNLAGSYERQTLDELAESALRAEQLSLEQFAALYRRLVG